LLLPGSWDRNWLLNHTKRWGKTLWFLGLSWASAKLQQRVFIAFSLTKEMQQSWGLGQQIFPQELQSPAVQDTGFWEVDAHDEVSDQHHWAVPCN